MFNYKKDRWENLNSFRVNSKDTPVTVHQDNYPSFESDKFKIWISSDYILTVQHKRSGKKKTYSKMDSHVFFKSHKQSSENFKDFLFSYVERTF